MNNNTEPRKGRLRAKYLSKRRPLIGGLKSSAAAFSH
jgi:hypothetical protein